MKPRSPLATHPAEPLALWGSLAMKAMQMSTAAAQVIAIRTRRLAVAGLNPSADDCAEMARMGSEKAEAFARSGRAIVAGVTPAMLGLAGEALRGGMDVFHAATRLATSRTLSQTTARQQALADALLRQAPTGQPSSIAAARLAHRALEPVYKAATGNAKRLSEDR